MCRSGPHKCLFRRWEAVVVAVVVVVVVEEEEEEEGWFQVERKRKKPPAGVDSGCGKAVATENIVDTGMFLLWHR